MSAVALRGRRRRHIVGRCNVAPPGAGQYSAGAFSVGQISRTEVVSRTGLWPYGTVPYSQSSTNSPTGHRQDCSGYASMCLGLPTPGLSTVTMVTGGYVYQVGWEEILPGDLIGHMGENTGGDGGHVQVYIERTADGGYAVMEQAGGRSGPTRGVTYSSNSYYLPYRYVGIVDSATDEGDEMAHVMLGLGPNTYYSNGTEYWQVRTAVEVDEILAAHSGNGLPPLANGGNLVWVNSLAGYGSDAGFWGEPISGEVVLPPIDVKNLARVVFGAALAAIAVAAILVGRGRRS